VSPADRWRLILGESASDSLGGGSQECQACDSALSWLYDREADLGDRGIRTREGGSGGSSLAVVDWINTVHRLFPKETIERLEADAVGRYGIDELVTSPEVLKRVEPNPEMLRAVLRTKHLMNPEVLSMARKLVAEVVRQLMEKLKKEVRQSFCGPLDRRRRSHFKVARNFDFRSTLRQNLKYHDGQRVLIRKPLFNSRTRVHTEKWQVILVVDQSGSMLDSVIHSAVTAACLWGVPGLQTHLVIFDTQVVDLTDQCTDPVETLMKVQLGGGTDIAGAVEYAAGLVKAPRRTIVVLITDFYEGGSAYALVSRVKKLHDSGTLVLGLAALDSEANPTYDRELAERLVEVGAQVGAMTPGELAGWIAEKVGR
jgi:Mg-chelatase subunit ChlD